MSKKDSSTGLFAIMFNNFFSKLPVLLLLYLFIWGFGVSWDLSLVLTGGLYMAYSLIINSSGNETNQKSINRKKSKHVKNKFQLSKGSPIMNYDMTNAVDSFEENLHWKINEELGVSNYNVHDNELKIGIENTDDTNTRNMGLIQIIRGKNELKNLPSNSFTDYSRMKIVIIESFPGKYSQDVEYTMNTLQDYIRDNESKNVEFVSVPPYYSPEMAIHKIFCIYGSGCPEII